MTDEAIYDTYMTAGLLVYVHGTGWGTICDDNIDTEGTFG